MPFNIVNVKFSFNRPDFQEVPEDLKPVENYLLQQYSYDDGKTHGDYHLHIHFRYILHSLENREESIIIILSPSEPSKNRREPALANIFEEKTKGVKRIELKMADMIGQDKWSTLQMIHSSLHPDILIMYGKYKDLPVADYQNTLRSTAKIIEDFLFENGLENMLAEKTDGQSVAFRLLDIFINYREVSAQKDYAASMANTPPGKSLH